MTVFTNCLKDQKLASAKVLLPGRTRIFGIAPVDYSIHARQYYLDFLVAYQEARFDAEHAIGINKDSMEWSQMTRELLNMSPFIITGDYSKFGPTLMSKCVWATFKIMIEWYERFGLTTPEDTMVRESLAYEHMFAKHLMLNLIYRTFCGQPCGTPFTTVLNDMTNKLYIRCAWNYIFSPSRVGKINDQYIQPSSFRKYVKMLTYGDDLIASIVEFLVKYFNAKTIGEFLEMYGLTFTDSRKSSTIVAYASLYDDSTTFLKSTFKKHPFRGGVFIHQLEPKVIYETCNWIMKSRDDRGMSVQACQAMMLNAFGLGRERYTEMREKVLSFWGEKGVFVCIPTWDEEDMRMFDDFVGGGNVLLCRTLLAHKFGRSIDQITREQVGYSSQFDL